MTLTELRERAERFQFVGADDTMTESDWDEVDYFDRRGAALIAALCRALEAADDMASYRGEWGRDDYAEKRAALDALLGDTDAD